MSPGALGEPRVVLVGAGHGHLVALRRWQGRSLPLALTVIDPGPFSYSGMATGVVAGDYEPSEACVDPEPLVVGAGGRLLRDRVVRVDRQRREVHLATGGVVPYDLVSLNIGSAPALPAPPAIARIFPVKPVSRLHALGAALDEERAAALGPLLVVGGGVTAIELACCAATRPGSRVPVALVHAGATLASDLTLLARRWLRRALAARGVTVHRAFRVARIHPGRVLDEAGRSLPWGTLALAAGLAPMPLLASLELPVSRSGLIVSDALHAPTDDRVFAIGDCADVGGRALPAVGVHGVRAGPILAENLEARATGRSLERYRPRNRYLAIMNLGRGRALATWGPLAWEGRVMHRWKDTIDRRFLESLGEDGRSGKK